ncbi:MAG: DUF305 domain-containing protein [Corynebacterium sp.]|nr:DUF305 domain-containing protein [Corynebacterium sp.]
MAALVACALTVSGCVADESDLVGQGDPANTEGISLTAAMPKEANELDVAFLSNMIPHHQQAVEMSNDILAADGMSDGVRDLAQRIKDGQSKEIELMQQWMLDWGQEEVMRAHAGHLSMGMISAEQMGQLKASTGAGKEDLYLRFMYAHHKGALGALKNLTKNGGYQPLSDLAQTMHAVQSSEMEEMVAMLGEKPD